MDRRERRLCQVSLATMMVLPILASRVHRIAAAALTASGLAVFVLALVVSLWLVREERGWAKLMGLLTFAVVAGWGYVALAFLYVMSEAIRTTNV